MKRSLLRSLFSSRLNGVIAIAWATLLVFAIWVFSEMVDDTPKGEFNGWDEPVLRWVRGGPNAPQGSPAVVALARGVTQLGSAPVLSIVSVIVVGWLLWRRRWRAAAVLAVVALGAPVATNMLKHHFARTRPEAVPHLVDEKSWSFPSGHALASAAIYLTLSVVLARRDRRPAGKLILLGAGFLLSFLIGLSRIYLGVHYPTDVIAGWSAGTIWASIGSAALFAWEYYATRNSPPVPEGKSMGAM